MLQEAAGIVMAEQEYFKKALSNVMFDAASGGAIRHLTDLGYTVKQIAGMLSFPAPYERIQQTVWKYLADNGTICMEEPGSGREQERFAYVTDHDKYGKSSFRRVPLSGSNENAISWKESVFQETTGKSFGPWLAEKCAANGEEFSYASCDFGIQMKGNPKEFMETLELLREPYRDYIQGLLWEKRPVYHRLDRRMQEILTILYEKGKYQGCCYFIKTGEKVRV